MNQHAKFFCENCGAEVPQNAKFCRHCGRFFCSVRCPVCGTTGMSEQFKNGCPHCGYAVGTDDAADGKSMFKPVKKHLSCSSKRKIKTAFGTYNEKNGIFGQRQEDDPLPVWMYGITAAVLAAVVLCIWMYVRR
jgi:hypothetical protein